LEGKVAHSLLDVTDLTAVFGYVATVIRPFSMIDEYAVGNNNPA
jgi:hypothetical protein